MNWIKHFREVSERAAVVAVAEGPSSSFEGDPVDVPGLKPAVVEGFVDFSAPLEGFTPYMYTDRKGYVTTGIGNILDDMHGHPLPVTFALPWKHPDGSRASPTEVLSAWQTVKAAWPAVSSLASEHLTTLRLSKADVTTLVASALRDNHGVLVRSFPGYVDWPADAQLALHSMAWALGPGFQVLFPGFARAVNQTVPDFQAAAKQSRIKDGTPERNAANRRLFLNADAVQKQGGDPQTLVGIGADFGLLANEYTVAELVDLIVAKDKDVAMLSKDGIAFLPTWQKKDPDAAEAWRQDFNGLNARYKKARADGMAAIQAAHSTLGNLQGTPDTQNAADGPYRAVLAAMNPRWEAHDASTPGSLSDLVRRLQAAGKVLTPYKVPQPRAGTDDDLTKFNRYEGVARPIDDMFDLAGLGPPVRGTREENATTRLKWQIGLTVAGTLVAIHLLKKAV